MKNYPVLSESDFDNKLKWLMFFRLVFTSLLLSSTIVLQLNENPSPLAKPLLVLYGLIAGIFFISFVYALILRHVKHKVFFAYIQAGIDTFVVTLILFVTGGFSSIFSFLYLVVIIYSSILLFRRGSMVMAALCGIQFGVMVDLEYYGILEPFFMEGSLSAVNYAWSLVIYKIVITLVACFAVALLSGLLSEQERKTKKELLVLGDHVKRVTKMAYMGEMAAGMAHEIKNPLASLSGSIQLLRESIHYNPDHDKLMQIVLRETDRLSSLVNNFLIFAKPPSGKVETIRLDKAVKETVKLLEKDATWSGRISINNEFSHGIWIAMDPEHLSQVFWNLLLNAVESIEDAGLIDIRMYAPQNGVVAIKIADSGCGMPEEVMKSIFDPFFTTKHNGTGLGLSIVHSILEAYDSRLEVESEANKGTTFILKFKTSDPPT